MPSGPGNADALHMLYRSRPLIVTKSHPVSVTSNGRNYDISKEWLQALLLQSSDVRISSK